MTEVTHVTDEKTPESGLASIIGRLAVAMSSGQIGSGELAQLKRLNIEAPDQPPFWKIMAVWISPDYSLSREQETRWAMAISGMAKMVPFHHVKNLSVGRVLAENEYSELRLLRLLRSRGASFADTIRRTCSFLASRAQPLNWIEFAALILSTDSEKADDIRRRIARDYYAAIQRKERIS